MTDCKTLIEYERESLKKVLGKKLYDRNYRTARLKLELLDLIEDYFGFYDANLILMLCIYWRYPNSRILLGLGAKSILADLVNSLDTSVEETR